MQSIHTLCLEFLEKSEPFVLATIIRSEGSTPRKAGAKMLLDASGKVYGTVGGGLIEKETLDKMKEKLHKPGSEKFSYVLNSIDGMICGGSAEILIESC